MAWVPGSGQQAGQALVRQTADARPRRHAVRGASGIEDGTRDKTQVFLSPVLYNSQVRSLGSGMVEQTGPLPPYCIV